MMISSHGFIYWVQAPVPGHIKIGFTKTPAERLKLLRTISPVPLELIGLKVGFIEDEAAMHKQLAAYRLHGEWFSETVAVLKSVVPAPKNPDELANWCDQQIAEHKYLFGQTHDVTELIRLTNAAIRG